MKYAVYIIVIFLSSSSCRFSEVEVDSDYSYAGKFNRYKTFSFIDNQMFSGEDREAAMIEHNISRILQSWGYRYKKSKYDILISYDFFLDDVSLVGYNQPKFHNWVSSRFGAEYIEAKPDSVANEDEVRRRDEKYHSADVNLNEGAIYVTFIDRKKDASVWQGYAAGVFGGDVQNNERKMRAAIIRILDEFRLVTPSS